MKNLIIRLFFTFLLSAGLSSAAFAHPNMVEYSITHIGLHIVASVGIYIVMMLAGLYFLKRLPKAKKVRIRIKNNKK